MARKFDKKLVLEDGSEYFGYGFGADKEVVSEVVFNTSMVGYQEILSDPSYTYQAVVMTYPLIGNYGINSSDYESAMAGASALVISEYNPHPSNFRSESNLSAWLKRNGVVGIEGIDTRKLTRSIRDHGSKQGIITDIEVSAKEAIRRIQAHGVRDDSVKKVSIKSVIEYGSVNAPVHIAAIDCGMKANILRSLLARNCRITVFPYDTKVDDVLKVKPDGLFLSNGPGNPADVSEVIELVKQIKGKLPIFGICLGHQIISLAYGAKTYKLKFGHHGGNHPVKNLKDDKVEITSQNHNYAVDAESLNDTSLKITHVNLLDGTVEGVENEKDNVFSVQYHPESAPGPEDSSYLFDKFLANIRR